MEWIYMSEKIEQRKRFVSVYSLWMPFVLYTPLNDEYGYSLHS